MNTTDNLIKTISQALDSVHGNGSNLFMPKIWVDRIKQEVLHTGCLEKPIQALLYMDFSCTGNYVRLSKSIHDDLVDYLKGQISRAGSINSFVFFRIKSSPMV